MTKKLELYKCDICNNLVEVVLEGEGELVCCGEIMRKLEPKNNEKQEAEMKDKHIPIIEQKDDGILIRVGEVPHPMTKEHHISFIEAVSDDEKYVKRKYFEIDESPDLYIKCNCKDNDGENKSDMKCYCEKTKAKCYCNIHELWGKE